MRFMDAAHPFPDVATFRWSSGAKATLESVPGPPLFLGGGLLGAWDPLYLTVFRDRQRPIELGVGAHPTRFALVSVPYRDEIYRGAAFAAVGRLDEVHVWDSVGAEEGGTHCYSDSRMPCFFDAGVLADLDGMFRDPDFVSDFAEQVSEETVAPVEFGGQVAAVAFADNGGSGVYEVLGGFDAGGALVAALIDVGLLEQHARERLS